MNNPTQGAQIAAQINAPAGQIFVPNPSGVGGTYMNTYNSQIVKPYGSSNTIKSTPTGAVGTALTPSPPNVNSTNTSGMSDILKGIGIAAPVAIGIYSAHKANKAANEAESRAFENEQLLASLEASRQDIQNPYANLSVATQAAEFQAEQADISLANTLDTLRSTGAGAGGATALAQAALQSKQGVSANIEQQEAANEKLKAQGEQFVFQARETREMQKLDRTAGLIDRDLAQEAQFRSDAMGALTGGVTGATQMASAFYGK
jgi:hypothetical protein